MTWWWKRACCNITFLRIEYSDSGDYPCQVGNEISLSFLQFRVRDVSRDFGGNRWDN
jgi:hypothetical protein